MKADESVLSFLRRHRKNIVHTIDPFKTQYTDGLEKVEFLARVSPFAFVGSTDCPNFRFVSEYVADLKKIFEVPVFTHFLPQPGMGYPVCPEADGFFATSVINSSNDYLACCKPSRQPLIETFLHYPGAKFVNVGAITLGEDEKSMEYAQTFTVGAHQDGVIQLLARSKEENVECYYVFCRKKRLDPSLLRAVRSLVGQEAIVFGSGCITGANRPTDYWMPVLTTL